MNFNDSLFGKVGDSNSGLDEIRALVMKSNQLIIDYIDADRDEKQELRNQISLVRQLCEANAMAIEAIENQLRES